MHRKAGGQTADPLSYSYTCRRRMSGARRRSNLQRPPNLFSLVSIVSDEEAEVLSDP